jgi:hypothetical protein
MAGSASFDRIRYRYHDGGVFLYAFDSIELDGGDPLAVRKATLASLFTRAAGGLRFNEHLDADSDEAGHAFQSEAGHLFRSEAGRGSDLMSASARRRCGSMDDRFCWLRGQVQDSAS